MKSKIAIYLAGSIKKEHEKVDESYWTEEDLSFLKDRLEEYEVAFLNPAFRTDDLSDQKSVFGRDMMQVFSSNVVFVDARERRGLGVGAEMMWAKVNRIPVLYGRLETPTIEKTEPLFWMFLWRILSILSLKRSATESLKISKRGKMHS